MVKILIIVIRIRVKEKIEFNPKRMENEKQDQIRKVPRGVKLLIIAGSFLFVIIISLLIGGWLLQNKSQEKLKAYVLEKTDGQYRLDFDKLTISLFNGSVNLKNIVLDIDTQAYTNRPASEASDHLIKFSAKQIKFSGIDIMNYFFNKKLLIKTILLDEPDIVLYQMRDTIRKDSTRKDLYEKVPAFLKGFKLSTINVNNLSFAKQRFHHLKDPVNQLRGLSFSIHDISIDSLSVQDPKRIWFSKNIQLNSENLNYTLDNGLYVITIDKVTGSTQGGGIEIDNFKVVPLLKEIEFSKKLGKQGDRYDIRIPSIKVKAIDFKKMEIEGKVFSQSIELERGEVMVFNNKTLRSVPKKSIQNAPQLVLARFSQPLFIDTILIKDFEVHYKELNPTSRKMGDVFFTKLDGKLSNITNDSLSLSKNHWLKTHFATRFLGNAPLVVDINFNLPSKTGEFTYKGHLGSASATTYNKLLEPMAMVTADKGVFNKISFDIKANIHGANGTVQALYKDLKVSLLTKDDSGHIGKEGLVSFLANTFLITSDNPIEGQTARVSYFSYHHEPTHSFFNLMWKGVFTGLKENLIQSKEEKKEQKKIEKEQKKIAKEKKKEEKRQLKLAKEAAKNEAIKN